MYRGMIGFQIPMLLMLMFLAGLDGDSLNAQDKNLELLEEQAFREAVAVVDPSVVRIQTLGGLDRIGDVLAGTGPTTGVVVGSDGWIITSSFNFASLPSSVLVTLHDGRNFPAKVVAKDLLKQLTLLKIEADNLVVPVAVPQEEMKVGQWSIAVGRTYSVKTPNISVGIVSALNRVWGKALQTDAKISPANYGGPLVDVVGRVQGILVPLTPMSQELTSGVQWYDSGIGFAIPFDDVLANLDRLKKGDLQTGLLGITFKKDGLDQESAVVGRVRVRSPAEEAGLKSGDRFVEVNGEPIRRQADVKHVFGRLYADDEVSMVVARGDEQLELEATLVAELVPYERPFLGIVPERRLASDEAKPGIRIRHVIKASPAEAAKLQRGMSITAINEQEVNSASDLSEAISQFEPGIKVSVRYAEAGEVGKTIEANEVGKTVEVELAAVPSEIVDDLRTQAVPPGQLEEEEEPKRGRITGKVTGFENEYWMYVSEDYNPNAQYGLVVWLHPSGDTMEATMLKHWRKICNSRQIILLAPKARQISGWTPNEAEFIRDAIKQVQAEYSVDPSRIVMHTMGNATPLGAQIAFEAREIVRGLIAMSFNAIPAPPENHPDFPLQFLLISKSDDATSANQKKIADALKERKFPVTSLEYKCENCVYPPEVPLRKIELWLDAIDRI